MIDPEVGEVVGGRLVQMTLLGQPLAPKQAPKRRRKRKFQVSYGPRKSLRTGPGGFSSVHFIPPHARMSQQDMHGVDQSATDIDTFRHVFPVCPAPNSTLITFQNIGPQRKSAFHPVSRRCCKMETSF